MIPSPLILSLCERCVHASIALVTLFSLARAAGRTTPLPPAESLAAFRVEAGLRVELVAAEPLVVDPIAFTFDEHGRLFVVEARGYPEPAGESPKIPEARIARLEDTDGDGRMDRRTEFATGLTLPNGITAWGGGVFVTCAPDIFFFRDTNGDGVADERRVVLTGFDTTRTSQIRVSSPSVGLDGKIYVACGANGGKVTSPLHPDRPAVVFSPADGRFDPHTFVYETISGRGQFGLAFDAYGRRFTCSSRDPAQHAVLEPWHLRNPYLAITDTRQEVAKSQAEARVYPISRASVTADFAPGSMKSPHAGTFTSACGVMVFGGSALTPEHVGSLFVCEPAQNLVQRQVMKPEGASFRAEPATKGMEFLASTDTWFRPVFLANGPDGALYVADMHRREIDHPSYVPELSRGELDFESGKNSGRIYRIVKADTPPRPKKLPGALTNEELFRRLEAADSWLRESAQRMLVERGDRSVVPRLEKCATSAGRPESRARALWTLQVLGGLEESVLESAFRDAHPGVREQALTIAASRGAKTSSLRRAVSALLGDTDPRVRFVAALGVGSRETPEILDALAGYAARDGEDRWARAAALSAVGTRMPEFFEAMTRVRMDNLPAFAATMEDLARALGAGAPLPGCREFLQRMLSDKGEIAWRISSVLGLAEGLRSRADFKTRGGSNPFQALLDADEGKANSAQLGAFFQQATLLAADERAGVAARGRAISLLGYSDYDRAGKVMGALLESRHPLELQLQAVRALERFGDTRGAEEMLESRNWKRYTPQVREAVLSALVSRPAMTKVLFASIESGRIQATEISSGRRGRLLKHSDVKIKEKAEVLFAGLDGGDRMAIYQSYRDILQSPAKADNGRAVFTRVCSACHTYGTAGGHVGPDLSGVRHQPADALLMHIIVPNLEVAPGYQSVSVTLQDGSTLSGWLQGETASSVTLRTTVGIEEVVLRTNIASLSAPGLSIMPDGLEQTMTRPEMADLIAFLKSGGEPSR